MIPFLRHIAHWIGVHFPDRAYNLIMRRDWQPVRFLLAFAFLFVAVPEQFYLITATGESPVYSKVYVIATVTSLCSGLYYLHASTSDLSRADSRSFRQRYIAELGMLAAWVFVFIVDIQAHDRKMLVMGDVEWQHNIGVNAVLSLALCCCMLNNMSFSIRAELREEYELLHMSGDEYAHDH